MAKMSSGLPINAIMGWQDGVDNKKDAIAIAKGFIAKRFTAQDSSWFAVQPFMGGYFWEAHEGGSGQGYLDAAIKALSDNPESKFWFPSGDRAFQLMLRDGKPFCILLSGKESAAVQNTGQPSLPRTTSMKPAVRKGEGVFMVGAGMLASGFAFLTAAVAFYGISANPGPSVPAVDFAIMPHAQWHRVAGTQATEIVSKIEFDDGTWNVTKRDHKIKEVSELQEVRSGLLDMMKPTPIAPEILEEIERSSPEAAFSSETETPPGGELAPGSDTMDDQSETVSPSPASLSLENEVKALEEMDANDRVKALQASRGADMQKAGGDK